VQQQKTEILIKKSVLETIEEETTTMDNSTLSMDNLIKKMSLLSKSKNPYSKSKEIEEIKSIFYNKINAEKDTEKNEVAEGNTKEINPLELKFKTVFSAYRKIKSDFRNNKENEEEKNLKTKKKIIEDIDALAKEEESIKTTFEKFRQLQEQWKKIGHVPITENNNLWQSYHHHVELFYDFIKLNNDLRDLDFKRNFEEKNKIYKRANELLKEKSVNKAHNNLQELHEHWKNIGPVKRDLREPLWEKFKEISRKINKKRNDYFIQRKREENEKIEEKNRITSEIDNLTNVKITSYKQWQEATNKCNELEKKWKLLGGVNKGNNKLVWKKLRDSLNNFYNTRNDFQKIKREENKQNVENKLAICKKAEKLQNSSDWQRSGKELMKLQEEWKNSEFSPAKQSNEIWRRFRVACDTFFKSRKDHYKKIKTEEERAYKEKEELVKELEKFKAPSEPKEGQIKLNEFSLKWKSIRYVSREKTKINDHFFNLLNSKFIELGLNKGALATEQYKNKISSLKGNSKAISNEQQFISDRIDVLKREITQYENNITFFSSGKSTEKLFEQAKEKIDNAKADIEDLKQKLQMLNKA